VLNIDPCSHACRYSVCVRSLSLESVINLSRRAGRMAKWLTRCEKDSLLQPILTRTVEFKCICEFIIELSLIFIFI
jgi:hypothetical protein